MSNKGIYNVMLTSQFKDYMLTLSSLGTKVREQSKQSVNWKKWIHCQLSSMAMLLLLHKGPTPLADRENRLHVSREGKKR